MTTNLLAILLSLAMLLTGATAPVAEPASRTMTVNNIIVRHNDEEVALSPYASLGIMTDGAKAVADFFIGNGEDVYLPFQASVSADGVLVQNDNSKVTLKIDRAQLDEMLGADGEESMPMFDVMADYIAAYGELIRLMTDVEGMEAIQQKADALYDELVDRGAGEEGTMEYDDELYDVVTYDYDLTAQQIGALADAVYTADERLANYAKAYFRLLAAMPEDSGLDGADSFEALFAKFDNLSMHVTESIAENGLNVSDVILHIAVPEMEKPVEFVIHGVKDAEGKSSEVNANFDAENMTISLYIDALQTGPDMQMNLSVAVNPAGEAPETTVEASAEIGEGEDGPTAIVIANDAEAEVEDEAEAETEDEEDGEEDEDIIDAEGDSEDAYFFAMDYDREYDEATNVISQTLSYGLDAAAEDIHYDLTVDGVTVDAGESDYQVTCALDVGDDAYGLDFFVTITDEDIEDRIDANSAVGIDAFDPTALMTSVSADAMKLYSDEGVQKLIAMAQAAMEQATESGAAIIEDVEEFESEGGDAPSEPVELPFENPQFGWLPEGYRVENLNVDNEFQDVNCSLVNDAGDSIFVDITASYADTTIAHYTLDGAGAYAPVEGTLLNEEVGDGFSMYTIDDGEVIISMFPSTDKITTGDIVHILSSLTF